MRHFRLTFKVALLAAGLLISISTAASDDNIISFDPPGGIGTQPAAINASGTVVGRYQENNGSGIQPGFIRDASGNFTSLHFPIAGVHQTTAVGLNDAGQIAGWYVDGNITHGFLRNSRGHYTSFDPPGSDNTQPLSINNAGQISGVYTTGSADTYVGFLRGTDGSIVTFGGPGICGDYVANAILNDSGEIAGTCAYNERNYTYYTYFVRSASGTFTQYRSPFAGAGILVSAINDLNVLTGAYIDTADLVHGFWRDNSGVHSFDYPGALYTSPTGINLAGTITGYYSEADGVRHGFVRDNLGNFTSFDDPDAGPQGTTPTAINRSGQITGQFTSAKDVDHGFLRY